MRQITYHIHRYQQGRAFVQTFKFDYEADRTILWGLQKIKDTQDPTLTFLAACRSAVCGACSIRVNGEAMPVSYTHLYRIRAYMHKSMRMQPSK